MARTPERIPKENTPSNRGFGIAWLLFAIGLGFHVADEATHNFLSTYNPSVRAIRARFPFLPLPTFTFAVWLTLLIVGILLLLCLSPLAFRGSGWLRIVSLPLAIVIGVLNAALHISSSVYFHRWMPGVFSSPLLLLAAIYLLTTSTSELKKHASSNRPSLLRPSGTVPSGSL
jgi:uncharacterized protein with HXXEE motif